MSFDSQPAPPDSNTEGRDRQARNRLFLQRKRAGDRGRTGDVQLGKLIDEGPED
jgi:hypothetical protein